MNRRTKELLLENTQLRSSVQHELAILEEKIRLLENISLSIRQMEARNEYATRAPVKVKESASDHNRTKKFLFFLSNHSLIKPRGGRIEDPFADAGLCASPHAVRVLVKDVPPNPEALRLKNIILHYNVATSAFKDPDEVGFDQEGPQANETGLPGEGEKAFRHFVDTNKRVRDALPLCWSDFGCLRNHVLAEYALHLALSARERSSSDVARLFQAVRSLSPYTLKKILLPLQAKCAAVSKDTIFFSGDNLFALKRLQTKEWVANLKSHRDSPLFREVLRVMLEKAKIFSSLSYADVPLFMTTIE